MKKYKTYLNESVLTDEMISQSKEFKQKADIFILKNGDYKFDFKFELAKADLTNQHYYESNDSITHADITISENISLGHMWSNSSQDSKVSAMPFFLFESYCEKEKIDRTLLLAPYYITYKDESGWDLDFPDWQDFIEPFGGGFLLMKSYKDVKLFKDAFFECISKNIPITDLMKMEFLDFFSMKMGFDFSQEEPDEYHLYKKQIKISEFNL